MEESGRECGNNIVELRTKPEFYKLVGQLLEQHSEKKAIEIAEELMLRNREGQY